MRRIAWVLLLLFVFAIPWEYSLDLGAPFGNIARMIGVILVLVGAPATLQAGRIRRPGPLQWLTLALYLWFLCSFFWTAVPDTTLMKARGYVQEMMIVWLIWEIAESPCDLRNLMRAWLAGSWVLAILTIVNFASAGFGSADQIRFVAIGQDPNDVARFLDLGLPVAAFLLDGTERWSGKLLAAGFLPLGVASVLLTASRGGFLTAVVALTGCAVLPFRRYRYSEGILVGAIACPAVAGVIWLLVPHETLDRIASIPDQLQNADLNQRVNIWSAGWQAFLKAPLCGHGAGAFVTAAGLAPIDTAHNTVVSILVEGGLIALVLATAIVAFSMRSILATRGMLRIALMTLMVVWLMSSLVGTVGESRTTWLLFAMIALSRRLAEEQPNELEDAFPNLRLSADFRLAERFQ
ncbi:MAG: O-antigen ligase family protein [Terracidiphilus sp.]